jgi:hypothetical protein
MPPPDSEESWIPVLYGGFEQLHRFDLNILLPTCEIIEFSSYFSHHYESDW